MELVLGGDLCAMLASDSITFGLPVDVIRRYTREILFGVEYLHENNVCHRDIKGANVLVTSEGVCKLANFGVAVHMDKITQSIRGTPYFISPEMIRGEATSPTLLEKSDVWSIGCTVFQMATGEPPWKTELATAPFFFRVGKVLPTDLLPLTMPDYLDPCVVAFIKTAMDPDPDNRPTAADLLGHDLVREVEPSSAVLLPLTGTEPPALSPTVMEVMSPNNATRAHQHLPMSPLVTSSSATTMSARDHHPADAEEIVPAPAPAPAAPLDDTSLAEDRGTGDSEHFVTHQTSLDGTPTLRLVSLLGDGVRDGARTTLV